MRAVVSRGLVVTWSTYSTQYEHYKFDTCTLTFAVRVVAIQYMRLLQCDPANGSYNYEAHHWNDLPDRLSSNLDVSSKSSRDYLT